MSFTWSSLNKGDMPKKADVDEIRSKMNSILNSLDKGLNWPYDEFAKRLHMYEYVRLVALRQSIDDLDAIKCNDCSSFNSYEKEAACPLAKNGYCSTDYSNALAVDNNPYDSTVNPGYLNDELRANFDGDDGIVYFAQCALVFTDEYANDLSSECSVADKGYDGSVGCGNEGCYDCGSDDTLADDNYNADANDGYDSAENSINYVSEDYEYFGSQNSVAGICSGHDSGYDSSYDFGYDETYYGDEDNPYNSTVYDTNDSGYDGTYYNDEDSPYDTGYDDLYKYGYDGLYHNAEDNPHDSTVYDTNDSGYDSSYKSGYDSTYYGGEDSPYDTGVYDTNLSGYDGTYYSGEDNPYDTGVYDTNLSGYDGTYDDGVHGEYDSGAT